MNQVVCFNNAGTTDGVGSARFPHGDVLLKNMLILRLTPPPPLQTKESHSLSTATKLKLAVIWKSPISSRFWLVDLTIVTFLMHPFWLVKNNSFISSAFILVG